MNDRSDRRVCAASILADARRIDVVPDIRDAKTPVERLTYLRRQVHRGPLGMHEFAIANEAIDATDDPSLRREAVRLMALCLGDLYVCRPRTDVYAGYLVNKSDRVEPVVKRLAVRTLVQAMDGSDAELDREIARLPQGSNLATLSG